MSHICIKILVDLKKWGLLYGENFGFCEQCAYGKQYKCVTFGTRLVESEIEEVR